MKKLVSLLLLAAMMCAVLIPALAEYPDPVEGIDFGGKTIYIYDYYTSNSERDQNPSEELAARYAYLDWIEETYNCKIVQTQKGDWDSNITEFINYVSAPDYSYYTLWIIEPGSVAKAINNGYARAWNDLIDVEDEKWNKQDAAFCTRDGLVYGMFAGNTEPRQCLFFDKKVLADAGIDYNEIYDLQAAGEWTWDKFEEYLQKLTRDTDGDGLPDVYGLMGDGTDYYIISVFSNGGAFFAEDENGDLQPVMNSDVAMEAMNWAKRTWADYAMPQPENSNWDWFKAAWKEGNAAFYMYQTYGGFNDGSEMSDMTDEWGCVAFPIGPSGTDYVHVASDNITLMPNVYDDETSKALAIFYDLYTDPTPGYDDEYAWIGNKYNYTDARAVDETYAMLRTPEHSAFNMTLCLGRNNDVIGGTLLWNLGWDTPESQIEQSMPGWLAQCAEYNGK